MTLKLSLETKILLLISIADCFVTVFLVSNGLAIELNPLFNFILKWGILEFIILKIGVSISLILILELFRKGQRVKFVKTGQRIAIFGYLMMIFLPNFLQFIYGGI